MSININIHKSFDKGVDPAVVLNAAAKLIEGQKNKDNPMAGNKILDFNNFKMPNQSQNPNSQNSQSGKSGGDIGSNPLLLGLVTQFVNAVASMLNGSDKKSSKDSKGTDPNTQFLNQLMSKHSQGGANSGPKFNSKGESITSSQHNIKSKGMTKDKDALDFEWDGKKLDQHVDLAKNTINGKGKFDMHKEGDGGKKADTDAMERLLKREGESEGLSDEQAAGLFRAMKNGGLDGKGLDVSNVMDQVKRLKNDPEKLDVYLEKIGAQEMSMESRQKIAQVEQENADPSKKYSGIQGLDDPNKDYSNLDLSVFTEYEITGKNKETGKKETIKVTKDDIAESRLEPGRLQGLKGKDLSHLEDVKIEGKVDLGDKIIKVNKMSVDDLNSIADGKKDWTDFKKKGFFEKIGDGIKGFFKGIGKAIKSVAVGAFNAVKSVAKGLYEGVKGVVGGVFTGDLGKIKDGFGKALDGVKGGFKGIADGVKGGLDGLTDAYGATLKGWTGAIFGDKAGDAISGAYNKVANFGKGLVTSVTDGAANVAAAGADIYQGRGNVWDNLKKGALGAFDVAMGVTGLKGVQAGFKAGMGLFKAGAKAGKAGRAAAQGGDDVMRAAKNAGKEGLKKADDVATSKKPGFMDKFKDKFMPGKGAADAKKGGFMDDFKQKFMPGGAEGIAGTSAGKTFLKKLFMPLMKSSSEANDYQTASEKKLDSLEDLYKRLNSIITFK